MFSRVFTRSTYLLKITTFFVCRHNNFLQKCTYIQNTVNATLGLSDVYIVDKRGYAKKAKDKKVENKPKMEMTDEELMEVIPLEELRLDLSAAVDHFKDIIRQNYSLRTGITVEDLMVEMEGLEYPIKELAQVMKKSPLLIAINCSSLPDAIKPILKTLTDSGMNLNPQQEGTMIYVPIPKMTREHREKMSKSLKNDLTQFKLELNKIYSRYTSLARKQKEARISSDAIFNACEHIKFMTDKTFHECEQLCDKKTKDILAEK
ncbi:ribosome-recycling factor-like protein [Leptotrombidium deliense]|uniref:Ribosome-recycling factor, mitochondrial n=1 Tax=Leptotrombidium deliense TaxID=299467 RepID=A0A443S7I3_9ACAR|nr:ribosome-recycling factor-like protein [Leptotrombidium deliense]